MKNKGLRQYRFEKNPLERLFAEEWENSNKYYQLLNYIICYNLGDDKQILSDRDIEVAATIIQWLGSDVGQYFINHVMNNVKKEV